MRDSFNNSSYLNNSNLSDTSEQLNNILSNLDISNINNNGDHYLCNQCLKFPYIKFCKDRKHIRLTCSCINNKKILIKDLFEKNILSIDINLFEYTNLNLNDIIENELKCIDHNNKFEGFSKIYLINHCESCIKRLYENEHIIKFDDIKIEDIKIELYIK